MTDFKSAAMELAKREMNARPIPAWLSVAEAQRGADAERELNIPAGAGAKLPQVDNLLEQQRLRRRLEMAPKLRAFMDDAINASLAKDDTENLTAIERGGKAFVDVNVKAASEFAKGALNIAGAAPRLSASAYARAGMLASMTEEEALATFFPEADRKALQARGAYADIASREAEILRQHKAAKQSVALGIDPAKGVVSSLEAAGAIERTRRSLKGFEWADEFARKHYAAAEKEPTLGRQARRLLEGFLEDPAGGFVFLQTVTLQSAPSLVAAGGTMLATGNPALASMVMGAGSASAEYTGEHTKFLNDNGIDIATEEGRLRLLSSPELLREADRRGLAKGLVVGMIDAISGGVASKKLLSGPVGNAIAQMFVQGFLGGAGEGLGDLAAGNDLNAASMAMEVLAEVSGVFVEVPMMAGRKAFTRDTVRAEKAGEARAVLEPLGEAATKSKLKERARDRFMAFLEKTDWQDVDIYVDASTLNTFFQEKDALPGDYGLDAETFSEAVLSGNDVAIPATLYADKIAGTEDAEFFLANGRFSSEAMSEAEAARFNELMREEAEREGERIEAELRADLEARASDIQVRDAMYSQFREAGRAPDAAEREASLWQAFFRTQAERYGEDPLELARMFGVRVEGPTNARSRIRDKFDIAINTLRARRAKPAKAESLMQFLIRKGGLRDPGGDVAALEGPDTLIAESAADMRQAGLFPGGRKGMGLDEAARRAAEEGFFPERIGKEYTPDAVEQDIVPLLLEALRREMAGEPVVRLEDMPSMEDDLSPIMEELDRLGLTLDMTNDEIAEAMGIGEFAGEGTLFQDDGSPLFVVHNIRAEGLRQANEIGGLAAPSIAIARGDIGMDNFGEISLVGDPSMADPKGRGVRAFDADVYSARQPRSEANIDSRALAAAQEKIADAAALWGRHPSDLIIDSEVSREGLNAISRHAAVKYTYLAETGNAPRIRYREQKPIPAPLKKYRGKRFFEMVNDPEFAGAVAEKVEQDIAKLPEDIRDDMRARWFMADGQIRAGVVDENARMIERESGPRQIDTYAMDKAVNKKISKSAKSEAAYEQWVRDTFADLLGARFFRTSSGRKRPYTLENIVREMKGGIRDAEGFNYGPGSIRSVVAKEFKSLGAVKASRDKIVSASEMEAVKQEAMDDLMALADEFAPYHASGKDFAWLDIFSEFLKDLAHGRLREWQSDNFSEPAPAELVQKAREYLAKLAALPTEYFEIKMQRAVSIDEFRAAIVPRNAPPDVVKILSDAGLEIVRYDANSPDGRLKALQSLGPKVFFQQQTPEQALIDEAIERFGVTRMPELAGYILPDGRMLDFSEGDSIRGEDHRAIASLDGVETSGTDGMIEFMNRTGAVRVDFNAQLFETQRMPTVMQMRKAVKVANEWGISLFVEASGPDGSPKASVELSEPTVDQIRAFFEEQAQGRQFFQQQTPEQFLTSDGEWRNQDVTVQDEDGNNVDVPAGLAADVLMERLDQARQILRCVNAG